MNAAWVRFVKSAYRKEPISSFILIVGAVDAALGGLDNRWSLFSLGIGTVGLAIALRWWLIQRSTAEVPSEVPQYYLPPTPSRPQLPNLNVSNKKHPPR
ncbi:hypothetical protein [Aerosakkonema funiforme]|uniref:Uncharacterized protein n=1 Tax=Aerosakkonema funiforme FACHB-1375 TaxID=2949571 RepID=A0A926V9I5_9CYAN|nr:hypothetical protein [Aerosakkonema funiforme]MBD2179687.1 hypothetical protein [Aerosakkonema funiforme FACHB-1375]